ncbi:MAG: P-loop NTPase [Actinomycetota bacterium]|nr:P-loop NTPase [Actinomycetota bacterium]MDQ3574609.1 P-loop NTPase [Actinomycetota bacterium]
MSSLRLAVAGKGGAGKTTLSSTLARTLARRGRQVVVVDADSNPNVAVALGCDRVRAAAIPPLPTGLVSRRLDGGPSLTDTVPAVVERYGAVGPDSVSVVHMAMPAHADEGCLCSAHATVSGMLADAAALPDTVTIVDLEASPEHLSRGTTRHVDVLFMVVEPYWRSLETARRMSKLAAELPVPHVGVVGNKARSTADAEAIAGFCAGSGLVLDGQLPWSDGALDADKAGIPLIDYDPEDPVVQAVSRLADRLVDGLQPSGAPA